MSTRATGIALAFVSAVISGVSIYVNGLGVKHFADATVYTTAKNAVAGLLLLGLLVSVRPRRPLPAPRRRAALPLLVVAVVGGSVPFVLFFEGLARAQSTQAAFIQKTLVIWVALLAVPFLRERLRWPHAVAIAILMGGQAWLAGSAGHVAFGTGEAMILAATLLWAVEIVYVKRLLASFDARLLATARMALGAVLLIGWVLVTGRFQQLLSLSALQWRWVLLTGVLLSGYVGTWYAALARAPAVDVTAVLVFGAVITALLAGTAGSAPINVPALALVSAGCALIAGTALGRRSSPPASSPLPASRSGTVSSA
ncbi:MAG TPA: DMT family transporter [Solirubrobacteraceae bacterium]|nr:DMT family transporter [Solirubrobacteraceae bacterium]